MPLKEVTAEDIAQARRRVKRFIETGQKVSRVRGTDEPNKFEYKLVHHSQSLFFKKDRLGRLRRVTA